MVSWMRTKPGLATAIFLAVATTSIFAIFMGTVSIASAQTSSSNSQCDNVSQPFQTDPKTYTLNVEGNPYKILYTGFISAIIPHSQNSSLEIQHKYVPSDVLVIILHKQVID